MVPQVFHSPAKINTILRVTGRRPDGYHTLEMVMVPLAFGDEIKIVTSPAEMTTIMVECSDPTLDCDDTNLCYRAAASLKGLLPIPLAISIYITKHTPIGAGLGGGSSNAAAVLRGLNHIGSLGMTPQQLGDYGVKLGADVPFFCYGVPAICTGIGDKIRPLTSFPKLLVLLVNPGFHLATPSIYRAYDLEPALSKRQRIEGLTPPKSHGTCPQLFEGLQEVTATLENDLQEVAEKIHPVITSIRHELMNLGAAASQMSGSGPTVFGLFETKEMAEAAASKIARPSWKIVVTETASVGGLSGEERRQGSA